MARLIRHDAKEPKEVKVSEKSVWICMCGLSNNKPFCDGSHKKTKDEKEGKIYVYDEDNNRVEVISKYS